MAAAAFSIREYAASMRGGTAAEGRRLFGIEDLPPLRAPRCRWWADEVASTLAAAAPAGSPRRAPAKAKPPKKRSLSDLFAASPPLALPPASDTGCKEQTEVDGDEALRAIARRAKEEKKRKRKRQEEDETAVAAAAPESSGGREPEGNFAGRKEALENPDLFAGLDTHSSWKPEVSQQYREKISERRKQAKINNINKKADTRKHIDNNKANKAGKPRDLENFIPRNGILKCTKHTSVKMVKEKRGSSEGKEVIELCCKSVKRVKFSEADAILELPERESLCKMFSDAMASSSSSSSSSSSFTSTEGDKCITTESGSSHMPMEAFTKAKEANKNSDHEDSADKCISAETGTSHIPMEAFTKTIEANKNYDHEDSTEPGNREMSPPLIDLNMALPESTELDHRYDSYSVVLNLEHTHEETLSSVVELLDGRENRMNFSVDSQRLESEESTADLEIITNSSSASTFLHGEAIKVSDVNAAGPPLSLTELAETHRGCSNVSVKDTMTMSTTPCALPDHTFQDSFRQQQGWFSTSDKFSSWHHHLPTAYNQLRRTTAVVLLASCNHREPHLRRRQELMAAAAMSYVHADVENLKATELRLGLPGVEETAKVPSPPSTPRAGSKRALAGEHREEEPKTAPPAAKAQVVGWPPVRSYRKSCFQQASNKTKAAAPAPVAVKQEEAVVAAAPPAAAAAGGSLYVKVSMDGAPYLRKIDLKMYKGYRELREALEAMFLGFSGDAGSVNPSDFAVTYEDKDGDLMLVGDVPFEMFMSTCKRLRIMKGSEARGLGSSKE